MTYTGEEVKAAAARGFALLTAHGPDGWRQDLDMQAFDMANSCRCALGQSSTSFGDGAAHLFLAAGLIGNEDDSTDDLVREYGFEAPYGAYPGGWAYDYLEQLTHEWRLLLTADGTAPAGD